MPYVYALADPRCGTEFYIGKGRKRRAWQHERDVRRGRERNAAKAARIAAILDAGLSVSVTILSRHETDKGAAETEKAEIAARPAGSLTNLNAGGAIGSVPRRESRQKALASAIKGAEGLICRLRPDAVERASNPELARWVVEMLYANVRSASAQLSAL